MGRHVWRVARIILMNPPYSEYTKDVVHRCVDVNDNRGLPVSLTASGTLLLNLSVI